VTRFAAVIPLSNVMLSQQELQLEGDLEPVRRSKLEEDAGDERSSGAGNATVPTRLKSSTLS
jgi:hypothetical protein